MGLVGLWVEEGAKPIWGKWLVVRPKLDCGGFKVMELQLGLILTKELDRLAISCSMPTSLVNKGTEGLHCSRQSTASPLTLFSSLAIMAFQESMAD